MNSNQKLRDAYTENICIRMLEILLPPLQVGKRLYEKQTQNKLVDA